MDALAARARASHSGTTGCSSSRALAGWSGSTLPPSSKLLYLPIETVDLTHVVLTGDGETAIVFDDEGRVISIALETVLKAM